MALDLKISEAIEQVVTESGQSSALARRLAAWLEAVNSGNEEINDSAAADRHLEILYEETSVEPENPGENV